MKDTANRFGPVSQGFHWLTVALFASQFAIALYMDELPKGPEKLEWYALHKSVGFTVLVLAALRLLWRAANPKPPLPNGMPRWQKILAHGTQHTLYLVMFLMPASGLVMSWAANYPVSVFGLFTLPNLVSPDNGVKEAMVLVHETLAWAIVGLVGLHVTGALHHHFVLKDNILRRMLPGAAKVLFLAVVLISATARAEPWAVDMAHSRLGFVATQSGAEFKGVFQKFKAMINFTPEDLEHSLVDVEIDMLSVDTKSTDRDQQIATSDWFHSGVFPTAQFRAERFVSMGEDRYEAHARLSMRDVGHNVVLPFDLMIEDDPFHPGRRRATVTGRLDLLRTAWGIGQGQWADTGTVGDKVVVTVDLVAISGK